MVPAHHKFVGTSKGEDAPVVVDVVTHILRLTADRTLPVRLILSSDKLCWLTMCSANSTGVPRNVCHDFWHSGKCGRGDQCSFEHRQEGSQPPTSLQEHFQEAGLRNFPGLTNDQFSVGGTKATPGETKQQLKTYIQDSFQFRTTDQVYRFLELLCNASAQNPNWVCTIRQTLVIQNIDLEESSF